MPSFRRNVVPLFLKMAEITFLVSQRLIPENLNLFTVCVSLLYINCLRFITDTVCIIHLPFNYFNPT